MTIREKGSRKIKVEQDIYRWVITPSAKGVLALTVQHNEFMGQLIRVYIKSDINEYWVEFPHVELLNNKIVKPAEVATIIKEAIKHGWRPREKGETLTFDYPGE